MTRDSQQIQHSVQPNPAEDEPPSTTRPIKFYRRSRYHSFDHDQRPAKSRHTFVVRRIIPSLNKIDPVKNKSISSQDNLLSSSITQSNRSVKAKRFFVLRNSSLSPKNETHIVSATGTAQSYRSSSQVRMKKSNQNSLDSDAWKTTSQQPNIYSIISKYKIKNNPEENYEGLSAMNKYTVKPSTVILDQIILFKEPNQIQDSDSIKQVANKGSDMTDTENVSYQSSETTENSSMKRTKSFGSYCCKCSRFSLFGSLWVALLLAAVIAAITIGIILTQNTISTRTTGIIKRSSKLLSFVRNFPATTQTTTSTTTTNMLCGATCMNSTVSTLSQLAFYSFDNVLTDATGNYPTNSNVSQIYVTGWIGSAISFSYFNAQFLSASHIPLNLRSFTIDFWFYATDLSSGWDFAFAGENAAPSTSQCLFLNIRNKVLFFGFFNADTAGNTILSINQWYHAAFIYDNTTQRQYIYLNGILDASTSMVPFQATTGSFTIGGAYIGGNTNAIVYYSGYIDHFTISSRAKTACEVYLAATVACYFPFDSPSFLTDSGPNVLPAVNTGATSVAGRVNQAFQFSTALSYITVNGISALTASNTAFTISMWINPTNITGGATLIHTSTQPNGQGVCLAMWGLTLSGSVTVNVIDSSNNTIPATASSALLLNTWTHIAQTFSTTTGNALYINGTLVASVSASTGRPIGPYVILGASPANASYCNAGSITMGQFYGSIDEYRVFGRQLTVTDICRLANP